MKLFLILSTLLSFTIYSAHHSPKKKAQETNDLHEVIAVPLPEPKDEECDIPETGASWERLMEYLASAEARQRTEKERLRIELCGP